MSRRLASVTLDNLDDLPRRCRKCVFWELDPVARTRAEETGDTEFEKEAWVSATLLEWGSCGKLVYVDGVAAGYVLFAPPAYVPRGVAFPTSPVSADAVLLMTGHVVPEFSGMGLGRPGVTGRRDLLGPLRPGRRLHGRAGGLARRGVLGDLDVGRGPELLLRQVRRLVGARPGGRVGRRTQQTGDPARGGTCGEAQNDTAYGEAHAASRQSARHGGLDPNGVVRPGGSLVR